MGAVSQGFGVGSVELASHVDPRVEDLRVLSSPVHVLDVADAGLTGSARSGSLGAHIAFGVGTSLAGLEGRAGLRGRVRKPRSVSRAQIPALVLLQTVGAAILKVAVAAVGAAVYVG